MDIDAQAGPQVPPGTKWEDHWEILKPTIEFWYLDKKLSMAKLAEHMKVSHGFNAFPHQYKHYLNKWGFKKNLRAPDKTIIAGAVQTRASLGRATVVEQNGRRVDLARVRRHMKNIKREEVQTLGPTLETIRNLMTGTSLTLGGQLFFNSIISFAGTPGASPIQLGPAFPLNTFSFRSPSPGASPSTQQIARTVPTQMPSVMAVQRAGIFMRGDLGQALRGLTGSEERLMSTWLHQFQKFGFRVSKQWSYKSMISGQDVRFGGTSATGGSGNLMSAHSMVRSPHRLSSSLSSEGRDRARPRQLCGWTVHKPAKMVKVDWIASPVQAILRDALENNSFTNIDPNTLPVAIPYIAKQTEHQPRDLLLESYGLAIMSGNLDLLKNLHHEAVLLDVDVRKIHPAHLAIGYLDGSKSCCKIIEFFGIYTEILEYTGIHDDQGYSLADHLMMSILKSHTDLTPSVVDESNKADRFSGDEVSICGRWDADSKCIRELQSTRVPSYWKHRFCHTSTQVICHSMSIFAHRGILWPHHESGLFIKRCTSCGMKLELTQLHTLVAVAFLLAEAGFQDEDLSGMVACLLCLISDTWGIHSGGTLAKRVHISVPLLLNRGRDSAMDGCTHQKLSPADFGRILRLNQRSRWSKKCETGWELFQLLLDRIQKASDVLYDEMEDEDSYAEYEKALKIHCREHDSLTPLNADQTLAVLWAGMQTELLTYRRVSPGDSWLSDGFDMAAILHTLQVEGHLSIGSIHKGLIVPPGCSCGRFPRVAGRHPREVEVSIRRFSNFHAIDDPERSKVVYDDDGDDGDGDDDKRLFW